MKFLLYDLWCLWFMVYGVYGVYCLWLMMHEVYGLRFMVFMVDDSWCLAREIQEASNARNSRPRRLGENVLGLLHRNGFGPRGQGSGSRV